MGAGHAHGHAGERHRWRLARRLRAGRGLLRRRARRRPGRPARSRCSPTPVTWPPTSWPSAPRSSPPGSPPAPTRTGRRTYGSYRAEVFASGLAVLLMLGVVGVRRGRGASGASGIRAGGRGRRRCSSSAASACVVNLVALVLLRGGADESAQRQGRLPRGGRRHRRLGRACSSPGWLVATTGDGGLGHRRRAGHRVFVAVRAVAARPPGARRARPARAGRAWSRRGHRGRPRRARRASPTCTTSTCGR